MTELGKLLSWLYLNRWSILVAGRWLPGFNIIFGMKGLLNSLRHSDAMCRDISGSTLAQVMAWCLTVPNHYLDQCCYIISAVRWHSPKGNFTVSSDSLFCMSLKIILSTLLPHLPGNNELTHYGDVIMGAIASQITSLTIVNSTVYSGVDQRKYQSSPSLAFVRGIHREPVNSPHKWPVTRKMFPFGDVIMVCCVLLPVDLGHRQIITSIVTCGIWLLTHAQLQPQCISDLLHLPQCHIPENYR